jgi:four helix bundle protein
MKAETPDNSKQPLDLRVRTRLFALRTIRLFSALPKSEVGKAFGRQVLRSGTSVGAHYREGCRARSDAEFISKLEGGCQEFEETLYWLELISHAGLIKPQRLKGVVQEANELMAIFTTIIRGRKK